MAPVAVHAGSERTASPGRSARPQIAMTASHYGGIDILASLARNPLPSGLKSLFENSTYKLSPVGTAESSPGRSPGERFERRTSPAGTAENDPGCNPGVLLPPKWTIRDSRYPTQDHVLGNSQPSLRDCSLVHANLGLTVLGYSQSSLRDSVLEGVVLTHALKPEPFSPFLVT